jgi:hypothetical protein
MTEYYVELRRFKTFGTEVIADSEEDAVRQAKIIAEESGAGNFHDWDVDSVSIVERFERSS